MSGLKGYIKLNGSLSIERNGKPKEQFCPFSEFSNACGDWCPLFVEPIDISAEEKEGYLKLCNGYVFFNELRRLDRE